ncbi:MAG: flagellar biosynthetic protein FliO [Tepidamorphaceae bacterium]|nr:flagellar biosynthetic protein FliO [Rhodobiaceae bacterium]
MQYIEQLLGFELGLPARFLIAFIAVMILIALTAAVIRWIASARSGSSGGGGGRGNRRQRLAVGEWIQVDDKRRLVLVRRDNVEHLLLIGGNADVVVEHDTSGIKNPVITTAIGPAPQPDVLEPPQEPRPPAIDLPYRSPLRIERADQTPAPRVEPELSQTAAPPASKGIGPRLQREMANPRNNGPILTAAAPAAQSGKSGDTEIESVASQAIAEALDIDASPAPQSKAKESPRSKAQGDDLEEALMKELESGD